MSILNCFSGGLFLSNAFLHVMPVAFAEWEYYIKEKNLSDQDNFPLPFVLIFYSFFIILMIDKKLGDGHYVVHHVHADINKMFSEKQEVIENKVDKGKVEENT